MGVGIDLVDLSRSGRFLRTHRKRAYERLLTSKEKMEIGQKRISPLEFSKRFAAKEAFFKALGSSWMGLEGFGGIEVKCLSHDRFRVKSLASSAFPNAEGEGRFFRFQKWVGAQVILWGRKAKKPIS